jgi:hypothetical protein
MITICNARDKVSAILRTNNASDLSRVREPGVQAVIFEPVQRAPWEDLVRVAVESRVFVIERCSLKVECSIALPHVLEARLPHNGLPFETRLALIDDLAALADCLTAVTDCRRLMLRLFTEVPTECCGFHVDTVGPGRPPFGLLKVYNGRGTLHIDPVDIVDVKLFYRYLGRRECIARRWREATQQDRDTEAERLHTEINELDRTLPFLRPSAPLHEVPAGAAVAFRHLDIREHWSNHRKELAWIHCSPMAGLTRLVANLTPLDGPPDRPRRSSTRHRGRVNRRADTAAR